MHEAQTEHESNMKRQHQRQRSTIVTGQQSN